MSLSALIIARDEEQDLPACLESLGGVADEVVVLVDAATSDRTEEVARAAGAKTARRAFDTYQAQRQAALELCAKDWVLWIDADERLSPPLRAEIKQALADAAAPGATGAGRVPDAFLIPFEVRFLGHILRHGGLGRERHLRLVRRDRARFRGGALHEGLAAEGLSVGRLSGAMLHEPYRDIADYLSKLDRYTTLAALKRYEAGQRFRWWHHLVLPWELFSRLVLRLGLLDGHAGQVWARLAAYHSWLKYAKLRELERSREATR